MTTSNVTDFQPERLQAFETMRDRYVGSEGVTYVQRPRQNGVASRDHFALPIAVLERSSRRVQ